MKIPSAKEWLEKVDKKFLESASKEAIAITAYNQGVGMAALCEKARTPATQPGMKAKIAKIEQKYASYISNEGVSEIRAELRQLLAEQQEDKTGPFSWDEMGQTKP